MELHIRLFGFRVNLGKGKRWECVGGGTAAKQREANTITKHAKTVEVHVGCANIDKPFYPSCRMLLEISSNIGIGIDDRNAELSQVFWIPDAGKHQKLW